MFSEKDLSLIEARGANVETILEQIENFKVGFPYLNVVRAATIDDGMIQLGDEKAKELSKDFDDQIFGKKLLEFITPIDELFLKIEMELLFLFATVISNFPSLSISLNATFIGAVPVV